MILELKTISFIFKSGDTGEITIRALSSKRFEQTLKTRLFVALSDDYNVDFSGNVANIDLLVVPSPCFQIEFENKTSIPVLNVPVMEIISINLEPLKDRINCFFEQTY